MRRLFPPTAEQTATSVQRGADGGDAAPPYSCAIAAPILVAVRRRRPDANVVPKLRLSRSVRGLGAGRDFRVHAGFAPDGTATLYGTAGEGTTIASAPLPASEPFAVRFDGTGQPTSALALPAVSYPDAGAGSSITLFNGALGASGDFAFGGNVSAAYGRPGFLRRTDGGGAIEATDTSRPVTNPADRTSVAVLAPLAGGDFALAGSAAPGT